VNKSKYILYTVAYYGFITNTELFSIGHQIIVKVRKKFYATIFTPSYILHSLVFSFFCVFLISKLAVISEDVYILYNQIDNYLIRTSYTFLFTKLLYYVQYITHKHFYLLYLDIKIIFLYCSFFSSSLIIGIPPLSEE